MVCADGDFIYAAEVIEKSIVSLQTEIQKDCGGLEGTNLQVIVPFETWRKVNSMSISNGNLFISHRLGISKIDLETYQSRLV